MGNIGNKIGAIFKRLFDYPIKRKPICFYRQEDFSSTGEPLVKSDTENKGPLTEYDKLVQDFYDKLLDQRRQTAELMEKNRKYALQKVIEKYPGWDEVTISNLHSLFMLFDRNLNGMLSFEDVSAILESLGDTSSSEFRRKKFDLIDFDLDSWINYDELLEFIYNFNEQRGDTLTGLAKLCLDASQNIQFVGSLSVGEQLEYGLF